MPRLFSWKVILYLLFAFMLDVSVMPVLWPGDARPVFLYLAVLYSAFEWNWFKTVRIALAVGLLRDLTGTQPLGLETIVLVSVSFLTGYITRKIEKKSLSGRAVISGIYTASVLIFTFLFAVFIGSSYPFSGRVVAIAVSAGFWNGILAPVFFIFSHRWFLGRLPNLRQYELFR